MQTESRSAVVRTAGPYESGQKHPWLRVVEPRRGPPIPLSLPTKASPSAATLTTSCSSPNVSDPLVLIPRCSCLLSLSASKLSIIVVFRRRSWGDIAATPARLDRGLQPWKTITPARPRISQVQAMHLMPPPSASRHTALRKIP
jgi:hypothetical protein